MPTVFRLGPYRFFFYASGRDEPHHIHVEREDNIAKYWFDPIRLRNSGGFIRFELMQTVRIIAHNRSSLMEAWNDYFNR